MVLGIESFAYCKSTKMLPNQLKKMKKESVQSSKNLSENFNQMAKVSILSNSNL